MRLSVVQFDVRLADVARNLERTVAFVESEAGLGTDLVVFPELSLTGYVLPGRADAARLAESVPGPSIRRLQQVAERLSVHIAVGLIERGPDGRLFNAAVFVGPRGVVGVHRKTHLPCMGIDRFLDRGDALMEPVTIAGTRVGCLICYEGTFPEPSRVLALRGAELIVLPTNWPNQESAKGDFMPATRALENVVWFAAVNRVTTEGGVQFLGNSSVADPGGRTVARAGTTEAVVRVVIDPAIARCKVRVTVPGELQVDRFGDRRPELYGAITAPMDQTSSRQTPSG